MKAFFLGQKWGAIAESLLNKGFQRSGLRFEVPSCAPSQYNPNQILVTSEWFGFTFYL